MVPEALSSVCSCSSLSSETTRLQPSFHTLRHKNPSLIHIVCGFASRELTPLKAAQFPRQSMMSHRQKFIYPLLPQNLVWIFHDIPLTIGSFPHRNILCVDWVSESASTILVHLYDTRRRLLTRAGGLHVTSSSRGIRRSRIAGYESTDGRRVRRRHYLDEGRGDLIYDFRVGSIRDEIQDEEDDEEDDVDSESLLQDYIRPRMLNLSVENNEDITNTIDPIDTVEDIASHVRSLQRFVSFNSPLGLEL